MMHCLYFLTTGKFMKLSMPRKQKTKKFLKFLSAKGNTKDVNRVCFDSALCVFTRTYTPLNHVLSNGVATG